MTALVLFIKKRLKSTSPISIMPDTNYNRHAPESAEQLMRDNWRKTGKSLHAAMMQVGDEIERQKK